MKTRRTAGFQKKDMEPAPALRPVTGRQTACPLPTMRPANRRLRSPH